MSDWQPISYMPAAGYIGSIARHQVARGFATADSLNMRRRPSDGAWVRRPGSVIVGDTVGGIIGCTESKWGAKARNILAMESASLDDGYPTYAVVFTDESDKEGFLYFYNTNIPGSGPKHWGLGRAYDTTNHYPASGTTEPAVEYYHKWWNLWCENSTQKLTRGISATARKYVGAGTRRALNVGKNMLLPSLQGAPLQWYERRFNDATSTSDTEPERVRPWGRVPPLWAPLFIESELPTPAAGGAWKEGEAFFVSVMFQYEDGSVSQPFMPVDKREVAATGVSYNSDETGYVILPTDISGSTDYFEYITWNLPIGPADVTARILLRSAKADTSAGEVASPGELFVCGVVPNNTTVKYRDYLGSDEGLLPIEATPYVHYRHAWPMRGRYSWEFDGRVALGYLKTNPAAIILCPTGTGGGGTAYRAVNRADDSSTTSGFHYFRLYTSAGVRYLDLKYTATAGGAVSTTTINLSGSTMNVQQLVDAINATFAATTNGGEWAAQLAPGADGAAIIYSSTAAVPMKLAETDGVDHGDDALLNDGTTGNVRVWSNAQPGIIYFSHDYLASLPTWSNRFMHTESSPELKQGGVYGSAFAFAVGPAWDIKPPEDAGILMGGRQLQDGCVVFYSKGVYLYRNIRGGRTGQELDYRLDKISSKGCIAWDSITGGNDWVGWLSEEGYFVTDGRPGNEHCLSYALFDPSSGSGDLSYEITQCRISVAKDDDSADFHAAVIGDRLLINYRTAASTYRQHEYDFSETAGSSGLNQVLTREGAPYGWSTPFALPLATMGAVRKSNRLMKLAAYQEASTGYSTGDGRIEEFDTGTQDDGTAISTKLYMPTDDFGEVRRKKRMRRFTIRHKGASGATYVYLYRNRTRTAPTNPYDRYLLSDSSTAIFITDRKRVKLPAQAPSEVYEFYIVNDGSGTSHEVHELTAEVRQLETR